MYKNFQKGSLLIELAVSIGILGLIAAIAVPNIRTFISSFALTNAAKEIVTDLRDAKQRTVSEQIFYYARFIEDENKYLIIKESTGDILKEKTLPAEINFSSINGLTVNEDWDKEARFNYFGAVKDAGTIILVNISTNATSTINIRPAGYISYN